MANDHQGSEDQLHNIRPTSSIIISHLQGGAAVRQSVKSRALLQLLTTTMIV